MLPGLQTGVVLGDLKSEFGGFGFNFYTNLSFYPKGFSY